MVFLSYITGKISFLSPSFDINWRGPWQGNILVMSAIDCESLAEKYMRTDEKTLVRPHPIIARLVTRGKNM